MFKTILAELIVITCAILSYFGVAYIGGIAVIGTIGYVILVGTAVGVILYCRHKIKHQLSELTQKQLKVCVDISTKASQPITRETAINRLIVFAMVLVLLLTKFYWCALFITIGALTAICSAKLLAYEIKQNLDVIDTLIIED